MITSILNLRFLFFLAITGLLSLPVIAQESYVSELPTSAISMMVVPDAYSFREMEDKLKNDPNYKKAISAVSKILMEKGYNLKSYSEFLNIRRERGALQTQIITDPYRFLMENLSANIFIYLDFYIENYGEDKQVNLQLTAKDKYTAEEYAFTPVMSSTIRRWSNNMSRPIQEAASQMDAMDSFCKQLDKKINVLLNVGRKVNIEMDIRNEEITFSTTTNNNWQLGKMMTDWVKTKAILNSVETLGKLNNFIRLEAQIPVINSEKKEYSPIDFSWELEEYLVKILQENFPQRASLNLKMVKNNIIIIIE